MPNTTEINPKKINSEEIKKINIEDLSKLGKLGEKYDELFKTTKFKYPVGSNERKEIEDQILAIDNRMKEEEAARVGVGTSSAKPSPIANNSGAVEANSEGNSTHTADFRDLSSNRDKISSIVENGIANNSITNTADGPNISSIHNKILSFKDKETFNSVLNAVDGIYDNLKDMGLDVRKAKKSEGKEASFYAIRFPEAYKGQRDVMKLTDKEIGEIKSHYEKETPEQKQSVDSRNYGISALGHKSLTMDDKLMFSSLGLKKVEEKSTEQENRKEGLMAKRYRSEAATSSNNRDTSR
jgi:hypothetical protein